MLTCWWLQPGPGNPNPGIPQGGRFNYLSCHLALPRVCITRKLEAGVEVDSNLALSYGVPAPELLGRTPILECPVFYTKLLEGVSCTLISFCLPKLHHAHKPNCYQVIPHGSGTKHVFAALCFFFRLCQKLTIANA